MIYECFKEILDKYETIRGTEEYRQNPFADRIRHEFKDAVEKLVLDEVDDKTLYHLVGNAGRWNNWANNVNIRIGNYNSCKSFRAGLYLFYYFKTDGSGIYISLDQGNDLPDRTVRIEIANKLGKLIDSDIPDGFVKDYSEGKLHNDAVISKFYKYDELTEDILTSDLKWALGIYERIIPDYLNIIKDLRLVELIDHINSSGRNQLKIDLDQSQEQEKRIIGGRDDEMGWKDTEQGLHNFNDFLRKKGYFFDSETIENYLLSLKVKPFAILTGNSGTGKTKLSQLFAKYLMEKNKFTNSEEYVTLKTDNFFIFKDWFGIGKKTICSLLGVDKYEGTVDIYFDGIKSNEQLFLSTRLGCVDDEIISYIKTLDDSSSIEIKINKNDLLNTYLDKNSKRNKNIISFERNRGKNLDWCLPKKELNNLLPIKNEYSWNVIIDGIETTLDFWVHDFCVNISLSENENLKDYLNQKSSEDKIKITVDLSTFKPKDVKSDSFLENFVSISNHEIVPVGANWTENRNIVGYYNVLTKEYQHTQSLDLILKAKNDISNPYFLILDEMNLSHVERYFSDFLSAMESEEKIPLHKATDVDVPTDFAIPKNLFVVGTVNIDETTYMFSPKVLDRANVMEFKTFEEISISNFIKDNHPKVQFNGDVDYLEYVQSDPNIRENILSKINNEFNNVEYKEANMIVEKDEEGIDKEIIEFNTYNVLDEIIDTLTNVNGYLKGNGSSFEFGYRTVNEILSFIYVAWKYENKPQEWDNWRRYLDAQILQKILPKIHGSQMVLGEMLDNLLLYCLELDSIDDVPEISDINNNYPYPNSAKKLIQMKDVLEKQRYVSFIN